MNAIMRGLSKSVRMRIATRSDIQLPKHIFDEIHHLPDSVPSSEDSSKYQRFSELYGKISDVPNTHIPSKVKSK